MAVKFGSGEYPGDGYGERQSQIGKTAKEGGLEGSGNCGGKSGRQGTGQSQ